VGDVGGGKVGGGDAGVELGGGKPKKGAGRVVWVLRRKPSLVLARVALRPFSLT
jgi:hypothetical protein